MQKYTVEAVQVVEIMMALLPFSTAKFCGNASHTDEGMSFKAKSVYATPCILSVPSTFYAALNA